MSLQAVESGPPSQISDTVSAAGVLDLAMQIAGRLLVGRHVGQRRRLVAAEIEVQGHVNVCTPQFVLPGTPRSARYVRSNHPVRRHRLQQVRALERLSIEIGCGLSFGEAATFCRPSAPADTICRPSAPADTAIRGGFRCSATLALAWCCCSAPRGRSS